MRYFKLGMGVYIREGAKPPLNNHSPSQTNEKRALKKNLFERGTGGEHPKSTKTKWNLVEIAGFGSALKVRKFWSALKFG